MPDWSSLATLSQPPAWAGLATLIILEIILSIDNLLFIAILSERLAPRDQDRARVIGLSFALLMRLGLLAGISWVMSLTWSLFQVFGRNISIRDLVLIGGGLFLLIKATMEIHERLEGTPEAPQDKAKATRIWPIVLQIVVLDAVFSLDSIITAIGMVDDIAIMMIAVVVAMLVMLWASKGLTRYVNAHPAMVILCLGFLLMVGVVLLADGFGYHIPRGYLYSAIGFSVCIETFNQVAVRKRRQQRAAIPPRQRTTAAVLRLLGGVPEPANALQEYDTTLDDSDTGYAAAETMMVSDVLALGDRRVQDAMTPKQDVPRLHVQANLETVLVSMRRNPQQYFLIYRESPDDTLGIARKQDILLCCLNEEEFDLAGSVSSPVVLPAGVSILDTLETFRKAVADVALVVDEYGTVLGIVTRVDLLEAITGDLSQPPPVALPLESLAAGYTVSGATPIYQVQQQLQFVPALPEGDYHTLAGFVISLFNRIPAVGETVHWHDWCFEVTEMNAWQLRRLRVRQRDSTPAVAAHRAHYG